MPSQGSDNESDNDDYKDNNDDPPSLLLTTSLREGLEDHLLASLLIDKLLHVI